jgi:hypothetical protein
LRTNEELIIPEEDAEGEEDPLKKNPGIGSKEVCLSTTGAALLQLKGGHHPLKIISFHKITAD